MLKMLEFCATDRRARIEVDFVGLRQLYYALGEILIEGVPEVRVDAESDDWSVEIVCAQETGVTP